MVTLTNHPIQLSHLGIAEFSFKSTRPPRPSDTVPPDTVEIKINNALNQEHKELQVSIRASVGQKDKLEENLETLPYYFTVRVVGTFHITDKFPMEHVKRWAEENAPFVIFPYLREIVYSLTTRAGFPPILLPLVEVPTFQLDKDSLPDN